MHDAHDAAQLLVVAVHWRCLNRSCSDGLGSTVPAARYYDHDSDPLYSRLELRLASRLEIHIQMVGPLFSDLV